MSSVLKFQKAAYDLIQNERFFGELLLECRVILDHPTLKYDAAVTSRGGRPTMLLAPNAMTLGGRQLKALIKHELMHILFHHLKINMISKDGFWNDNFVWNLAQDVVINQEIPEVREKEKDWFTVEALEKLLEVRLERYQTSQYYFDQIMLKIKDKRDQLKKAHDNTLDDHNFVDEEGDSEAQTAASFFDAIQKAVSKSAGNAPKEALQAIDAFKGQMETPWQTLLANFVARQITTTRTPTRKKLNRRYEHLTPGHKKEKELVLALCVDESGSMSDEWIGKIYAQIQELMTLNSMLHIIHADCEISAIETVKKGQPFEFIRRSNGGTAYGPAIKKASELNVDAIVYFGDMDAFDTPEDPGLPVLWVTTSNNTNKPGNFGDMIRLT